MAAFVLLIVLITLGIFASYCTGKCGFPGKPKNGTVDLQLDPRLLNEKHPEVSFLTATYSCDENHVLVPSNGRQCVGRRWDGEVPQCLEVVQISGLYENGMKWYDLKTCQKISSGYFYKFEIEKERRLHSIRLKTDDFYRFKKTVLTFQGRKDVQTKWENLNAKRMNHELDFSANFVLTGYSKSYHFKDFQIKSNDWFYICEIVLFAYYDECGIPEVPLHGQVEYKPGDTEATYRCDDGYKLDSNYSIRHCIQGRWSGLQPICDSVPTETMSRETFHQKETYVLIVICSGLIIIVVILLLILYKKTKQLSSSAKRSRREDDNNLEENQRVADSTHQMDSHYVQHEANRLDVAEESESAEKIRLNRQSRREWMEHHSHHYVEIADFADGSASSRPEEQPQLLYANLQEASQEGPIYAHVDKSKKTNRK